MGLFKGKLKNIVNDLAQVASHIPGPIGKMGAAVDKIVNTDAEKQKGVEKMAEELGGATTEGQLVNKNLTTDGGSGSGGSSGSGSGGSEKKGFNKWWTAQSLPIKLLFVIGLPVTIIVVVVIAVKNKKKKSSKWRK